MKKRKIIIGVIGVVAVVAAVFISMQLANRPVEKPPEEQSSDRVVVHARPVENKEVTVSEPITGRVVPADRLDIYAEVSGVSSYGARPFKSGNRFRRGEVLIRIDAEEFSRSLASAKSQFMSLLATVLPDLKIDFTDAYPAWRDYLKEMDVHEPLSELPEVDDEQLKFFLTGRNIYSTYYNLQESESRLDKYIIRAPFDGTLTESYINQSSLVRIGQQLGEFIKDGEYELESSVTFDRLQRMEIGDEVTFQEVNGSRTFSGKLIRINEKVDPTTQLIKIYFSINDTGLKSGIYLEGKVPAETYQDVAELPVETLVDDSFVFTVSDGKAVKTPVTVHSRDSKRIVVSGLRNGDQVITDKKNSAFEGTNVEIIQS